MPFTFFLAGSVLERLLLADTCPIIFDHEFIFGEKLPYSSHIALQKTLPVTSLLNHIIAK